MTILNVGNKYTIGNCEHIISKDIYKNYSEINIIDEKIWLCGLEGLLKLKKLFCDRNFDNSYCALSGTLLGSVRHNGFIPTDDDIDLMIFRDLYDDMINNLDIYNENLETFALIPSYIGFKLFNSRYGYLIDLFVYELYNNNYFVPSGPIINGESYFIMKENLPFCKFDKSIILPIKKNAGQFENLVLNLPNDPKKCIEVNYNEDAITTAIIQKTHKYGPITEEDPTLYYRIIWWWMKNEFNFAPRFIPRTFWKLTTRWYLKNKFKIIENLQVDGDIEEIT